MAKCELCGRRADYFSRINLVTMCCATCYAQFKELQKMGYSGLQAERIIKQTNRLRQLVGLRETENNASL